MAPSDAKRRTAITAHTKNGICAKGPTTNHAGCAPTPGDFARISFTASRTSRTPTRSASPPFEALASELAALSVALARMVCTLTGAIAARTTTALAASVTHHGAPVSACACVMASATTPTGSSPNATSRGSTALATTLHASPASPACDEDATPDARDIDSASTETSSAIVGIACVSFSSSRCAPNAKPRVKTLDDVDARRLESIDVDAASSRRTFDATSTRVYASGTISRRAMVTPRATPLDRGDIFACEGVRSWRARSRGRSVLHCRRVFVSIVNSNATKHHVAPGRRNPNLKP